MRCRENGLLPFAPADCGIGICSICADLADGCKRNDSLAVCSGPPTERHSVAAVIVGRGANDELSPAEVSGFARVQQAVGKRSVVATAPPAAGDSTCALAGAREVAAAAAAATAATGTETALAVTHNALAAPRNVEAGPADVTGRSAVAPPQQGGPATPGAPTTEGVRYITLQFHSVSHRA